MGAREVWGIKGGEIIRGRNGKGAKGGEVRVREVEVGERKREGGSRDKYGKGGEL